MMHEMNRIQSNDLNTGTYKIDIVSLSCQGDKNILGNGYNDVTT